MKPSLSFRVLMPLVLPALLTLALALLPARPAQAGYLLEVEETSLRIPPEERKRLHQDMRRAWEYHSEEQRTHQYHRENGSERETHTRTQRYCQKTGNRTECFQTHERSRKMSPEERKNLRDFLRQRKLPAGRPFPNRPRSQNPHPFSPDDNFSWK